MHLIIVSGRSGSGKSTALSVLEDSGFYCIDNLPALLLIELVKRTLLNAESSYPKMVVSIDARNLHTEINRFDDILSEIRALQVKCDVLFLDAKDDVLLERFSQTRRGHPLTNITCALDEALTAETKLLEPIYRSASLMIDTSSLNIYQLYDLIKLRLLDNSEPITLFLLESFGFKYGLSKHSDLVFDVRCLPNPYWQTNLRDKSGLTPEVSDYFAHFCEVNNLIDDTYQYLRKWLPKFSQNHRNYVTIGIGCTGGFHRSVYVSSQIWQRLQHDITNLQLRHRDLAKNN